MIEDLSDFIHRHLDEEEAAEAAEGLDRAAVLRDAVEDLEWVAERGHLHPDARDKVRSALRSIASRWATTEQLELIPDPDGWPDGWHQAKIDKAKREGFLP